MKFRPLHDRVVVKRIDADAKSAGGIIIPDSAQEKPSQGEVIAVGPGGRDESGKLIPIDLKKGDRVLFGKWSGTEVKIDGVEYLIMKESDIMGVIEQNVAARRPPKGCRVKDEVEPRYIEGHPLCPRTTCLAGATNRHRGAEEPIVQCLLPSDDAGATIHR